MKSKIITFVLMTALGVFAVNAMVINPENNPIQMEICTDPPEQNQISLLGDMVYNYGPDAIEAYYSNKTVTVCFHQNFGYVHVILIGDTDSIIYESVWNTAVQQTYYIPVLVESTSYELYLDNSNGYAGGSF